MVTAERLVTRIEMKPERARTHPVIAEVRRRTANRLYGFFVVGRLLVAPLIASFALLVLALDHVLWRQVTMACVAAAVLSVSVVDLWTYRRRGLRSYATVTRNIVLMNLAGAFMVFATGALESPFIFVLILMSLGAALFAPGRLGLGIVFGIQVPLVWVFAVLSVYGIVPDLVPDVFGGGARTPRDDVLLWTAAGVLTAVLVAITSVGTQLRAHVQQLLEEQVAKRDEELRSHAEQLQAMTTLSGEIAHELKNPLASVKGLAALVSKDLDGKAAERMTVLRREVDRMQAVLQEFLNFSRPLVPLSQAPVDMADLCRDVAELHAGVAEERAVAVEVRSSGDAELVCDSRKVKQILINLVQNALDASPPRGRVLVAIEARAGDVAVRVSDEGPGIPPDLGDRVFEAGVTGKADGSGLGLTVARLLARQHGGDLGLRAGEAGGCVAELVLPKRPPARGAAEAGGGDP